MQDVAPSDGWYSPAAQRVHVAAPMAASPLVQSPEPLPDSLEPEPLPASLEPEPLPASSKPLAFSPTPERAMARGANVPGAQLVYMMAPCEHAAPAGHATQSACEVPPCRSESRCVKLHVSYTVCHSWIVVGVFKQRTAEAR